MEDRTPTVSEKDREHFRRIGEWKRESHEWALREQMARSGFERLVHCLRAAQTFRSSFREASDDDPGALMQRAKELGLYRG